MIWALVFVGGGIGALLRFLVATSVQTASGSGFPFGTLMVNLLGCAAIGMLGGALAARGALGPSAQLFWIPGVLGGFTTFSAFGLDVLRLLEAGEPGQAIAYVVASVAGGVGAVAITAWMGRALG